MLKLQKWTPRLHRQRENCSLIEEADKCYGGMFHAIEKFIFLMGGN